MNLTETKEQLIELTIEELAELIHRAQEIKARKEAGDPALKALEEAGYDFKDHCCEDHE